MEATKDQKTAQPITENKPRAHRVDAQKPKKPISARKRAANKENSGKSTGPKTPSGKASSSQNAIKYGFYAQGVVLNSERAQDFENLREHVWSQLQPRNALEEIVAREIVDTHWRLQRLGFAEQTVFTRRSVSFSGHDRGPGFAFVNDVQSSDTFSSLARVDAMLTRRLYRAMTEWRKLRDGKSAITSPQAPARLATDDTSHRPEKSMPARKGAGTPPQAPVSPSGQPAATGIDSVPVGPASNLLLPQPNLTNASPPGEESPATPPEIQTTAQPAPVGNPNH